MKDPYCVVGVAHHDPVAAWLRPAPPEMHDALATGGRRQGVIHDGHRPHRLSLLLALWHVCSLFHHPYGVADVPPVFHNASLFSVTLGGPLDCPSSESSSPFLVRERTAAPLEDGDPCEMAMAMATPLRIARRLPRRVLAGSACQLPVPVPVPVHSDASSQSHAIHVFSDLTSFRAGDDHVLDWLAGCDSGTRPSSLPGHHHPDQDQDQYLHLRLCLCLPTVIDAYDDVGSDSDCRVQETGRGGDSASPTGTAWSRPVTVLVDDDEESDACACSGNSPSGSYYILEIDDSGDDDPERGHAGSTVGSRVVLPTDSGSAGSVPAFHDASSEPWHSCHLMSLSTASTPSELDTRPHMAASLAYPRPHHNPFWKRPPAGSVLQAQGTPSTALHEAHGVGVIVKALVQQNAGAVLFLRAMVCVAALLCFAHSILVLGDSRPMVSHRPTASHSVKS